MLEPAYRTTEDLVGTDPRTGVAVIVARAGQYLTPEDLDRYGIAVTAAVENGSHPLSVER